jgi:hypothetical protein
MSFLDCVNYQQEGDATSATNGMPSLFAINDAIHV